MYNNINEKSKVILPTNDLNFKRLFASPEFIHISQGFLQDLADYDPLDALQISSISIETPYNFQEVNQLKDDQKGKVLLNTEVDYACCDENGLRFILEMQKKDQKYLEERIAYNTGQKFAQNYARTDKEYLSKYSSLQPVIAVIILVDTHFKDDIPIRFLRPHDVRHDVYKNNLNLGLELYIEINKDISKLPESLKLWMKYFRTGRVSEEAPCYLQEAARVTERSSLSKKEQEIADLIEKLEQKRLAEDETVRFKADAMIAEAEERMAEEKEKMAEELKQGIEQGIEQERKRADMERIEIAKSLLQANMSVNDVAKHVNLPVCDVNALFV